MPTIIQREVPVPMTREEVGHVPIIHVLAKAVTSGMVRSGPAAAGPLRVRPGLPRGGRPRGGDDRRVTVAPAVGSYRGFGSGSLPRRAPAVLKAKIIGTFPWPLRWS